MRKKSRLFLSMASMVLTVALFCFGVYAALGVSYTISGSVVYQVKDVFVNIETSLYMSKDTSLTDQETLDGNVALFETNPQTAQTTTNTEKLAYSDGLSTYNPDTGEITNSGEAVSKTSEPLPINYGSYEAGAKGFAYYIVVSITNYGTEAVGVSVTNNINPQTTNSKVAVTQSLNIPARTGETGYATKYIVIGLALDDATKSVSDVTFNVPIVVSKTLIEEVYERVNANNEPDANGDYLLFGYYPQSLKETSVTITGTSPNENGYYTGSDGGLYALAKDGKYYKVEKLRWQILDDNYGNGTALIVCDTIIDKVTYQPNRKLVDNYWYATKDGVIITDGGKQVYANNYKHSNLRDWLTNVFYNKFTQAEKDAIVLTTVDNSTTSGAYSDFVCENTQDYVFALSYNESKSLSTKYFQVSAYAKANGAASYTNGGEGWFRTPSREFNGNGVYSVGRGYYAYGDCGIKSTGALPALQIEL